jgi:uncharacterized membrane protein
MDIFIGIIIGIIAYVILNLGKGIQKMAIEGYKANKTIKSKNSGVWIAGTILTSLYMFIQWIALFFAPVNVVAPLEGVGLIVLILFSYFVLNEDIIFTEIIGIILIVTGVVLATAFKQNEVNVQLENFEPLIFISFLCALFLTEGLFIGISRIKHDKGAGFILGTTAGTLMAFQTVSKRITAIPNLSLTIIFGILTLIFAGFTLLMTQLAFAKSKANRVVPCFTSASISLSILIGVIILQEKINMIQIIGIVIVIVGVIVLTSFRKESE